MSPTGKCTCPTRLRSRISRDRYFGRFLGGSLPALSLILGLALTTGTQAQTAGTPQPHSVRTLAHLNATIERSPGAAAIEDGRWRHSRALAPSRTAAPRSPDTTDATLAGLDRAIRLEPKNADHFLERGLLYRR
jgi:hypothetical protein